MRKFRIEKQPTITVDNDVQLIVHELEANHFKFELKTEYFADGTQLTHISEIRFYDDNGNVVYTLNQMESVGYNTVIKEIIDDEVKVKWTPRNCRPSKINPTLNY